jgi:hypothetical protein
MPACKQLLAVVTLLTVSSPRPLPAETPIDRMASGAIELVSRVFERNQRERPQPQAIPTGGATVRLDDLSRPTLVESRLRSALSSSGGELKLTVPGGSARRGDFSLGSSETMNGHLLVLDGNADIYGRLSGNLVTLQGNVVLHPGAIVTGDVLALDGDVHDGGGEIGGEVRTLKAGGIAPAQGSPVEQLTPIQSVLLRGAGVIGVFLSLLVLGFGLVMFGRQNLEIVSDTVSHSFGRAFLTGLLGQILLLPTFGMLVVGLVLSVAGILLLPFAVAVFALLAVIGIVGGYLAVAHAMGETYIRRRMALGVVIGSPNSYRYILIGLGALASLWAAWALFGWVPVAGSIVWGAAFFVTWLLGTAGFGAALLSRGGARENFAGRLLPPEALTDEYLWATPQFGVPAARRPQPPTRSRGS